MKSNVSVLGPRGTFTEIAARKVFPGGEFVYCNTVNEVFDKVTRGVEFGVVAIENSLEGSVNVTMDCLLDYNLNIWKEIIMDIHLCLASFKTKREDIRLILSHPHALAQCRNFLHENFPRAKLQGSESTSAAMAKVKDIKGGGAIGSKETARFYKLKIMEENVEDAPSQTRFIVISKNSNKGKKTSIIVALKDEPGTLYKFLKEFADSGINLTRIESRPSRKRLGEYLFFIDFEGSLGDEKIKGVMDSVKKKTTFLKVLGSY